MHLRDLLVTAGLAKDFLYLQADVTAFGNGIVTITRTTPAAALCPAVVQWRSALGDLNVTPLP